MAAKSSAAKKRFFVSSWLSAAKNLVAVILPG